MKLRCIIVCILYTTHTHIFMYTHISHIHISVYVRAISGNNPPKEKVLESDANGVFTL